MAGHRSEHVLAAAAAGVASVALGAGLGELTAALLAPTSSPVAAIGAALIDAAPPWAKDTAIAWFGTGDKAALLTGIAVILLAIAAAAGLLQRWRPPLGRVMCGALAFAGIVAATTRADASAFAWVPSVVAGTAAAIAIGPLVGAVSASARVDTPITAGPDPARHATPGTGSATGGRAAPGTGKQAVPGTGHQEVSGTREPAASSTQRADEPPALSRRRFFAWTGSVALVGVAAAVGGALLQTGQRTLTTARRALHLPTPAAAAAPIPAGAALEIPGLAPLVTPNADFYRIDTALIVPQVDPATWALRIHGMVEHPFTLTWAQLLALPLQERYTTLACVSNEVGGSLIGNAKWLGYPIRELLARARPDAAADMVLSRSADGFTASTPLEALTDGRDAILAVGMNGQPLPLAHGFPVRMVVPGLYGYVSATKWVTDLEVTRFDRATAYWTDRGWSAHGPVKLESRIDVPQAGRAPDAGDTVIAGVAWQQHVGIARVEVSIDDGPWRQATLAPAISRDTWVQWSLPWRATSGEHRIRCRAVSATGQVQTDRSAPPAPDGATGWDEVRVHID